jgi:hypothetical protein
MLTNTFFKAVALALSISVASAATKKAHSERVVVPAATRVAAPVVPLVTQKVNNVAVKMNTSTSANKISDPAPGVSIKSASSTILILARDTASSYSAFSGLNGYGIPYQVVLIPAKGASLPTLNSSATVGNYGGIVVMSEVSYANATSGAFQSALTAAQWAALYQYQVTFAVRMVRMDVFPGPAFGTAALGGCCDTGVEQLISITDQSKFPTAGLKLLEYLVFVKSES